MNSPESSRSDYMRNEGFLLVTDVGHQFFDDTLHRYMPAMLGVSELHPDALVDLDKRLPDADRALFESTIQLSKKLQNDAQPGSVWAKKRYGITDDELSSEKNRFLHRHGFGDIEFTWHFAPAVASVAVASLVRDGKISEVERNQITLGDWANVIGSVWFSDLMHDLALTSNGLYNNFGKSYRQYGVTRSLSKHIDYTGEELETAFAFDETINQTFMVASLTQGFRRKLRTEMKVADTTGCPVARRAGTLPEALATDNPHAVRLSAMGRICLSDQRVSEGKLRFTQDYTPIDRSLDVLAALLDRYNAAYGNPEYNRTTNTYEHHSRQNSDVLVVC